MDYKKLCISLLHQIENSIPKNHLARNEFLPLLSFVVPNGCWSTTQASSRQTCCHVKMSATSLQTDAPNPKSTKTR